MSADIVPFKARRYEAIAISLIKVINSPRTLEPGNGYTDWNVPWRTWLKGSALGAADVGAPAVGATDAPTTTVG